jgi:uncharacterized protein DUF6544
MNSFGHLDPPIARYFAHALDPGAEMSRGTQLRMRGRIKVGAWLSFRANWEGDGRSFDWRARVGPGGLLRVRDHFASGTGAMDIRLFARIRLVHAENEDTTRSAAGRAGLEAAIWAPASLLPEHGVSWRAESDNHIVATFDVPPERPEVHITVDPSGAVRSMWGMRWNDGSEGERGYLPFGGDIHDSHTFEGLTIASRLTVGWGYGTPRYEPFFEAEIEAAKTL